MNSKMNMLRTALCFAVFTGASIMANAASDSRIALVPPGPHPYFQPWIQAAADAKKDFNIVDVVYKVPVEQKLSSQAELLESLMSQGFNAFGIFPGDPAGINSTIAELQSNGAPVISMSGCPLEPSKVAFCLGTDLTKAVYLQTKTLISAIGGKGKIVHLAGAVTDPNTKLRLAAVQAAVNETHSAVTLETVADTDNEEKGEQRINALLGAERAQIDGMVATGYVQSMVAVTPIRTSS